MPSGEKKSVTLPKLSKSQAVSQAENAAVHQLEQVGRIKNPEDRHKAYKDLLRAWHPDKNPQNAEVATAVFQRIQSERARVLGK